MFIKRLFPFLFLFLASSLTGQVVDNAAVPTLKSGQWDAMRLEWNLPEKNAEDYLGVPIGNAMIGAKIKGGLSQEVYQLNNKTFWSGGPRNTDDPNRQKALHEVRNNLANNNIPAANIAAPGMWDQQEVGTYLPIGKMLLDFPYSNTFTGYKRVLDLDKSLCTIQYKIGNVTFKRESFASFPDKAIVVRISANQPGKISFAAGLQYAPEMEGHGGTVVTEGNDVIVMKSRAQVLVNNKFLWDEKKGMYAETRLKIINNGGSLSNKGNRIEISNANTVLLILVNETSYNGPFKEPGTEGINPTPIVKQALSNAAKKTYDQLFLAHTDDYQLFFRRVWLEINGEKADKYAVDFQFARYEMISVSRTGDRPHNQQGMWNPNWRPMSYCSHFLNENVEKYYSLIETANIAECGEPLWNWMGELAITGARTAKTDWGFKGWLAPHYSDIWCSTTLKGGNNEWAIWPMGGVWLCENLWDHYAFSMDKKFLSKKAYPIMKGAAEFCLDLLVDDGKGQLVTSPSTSPENQFELPDAKGKSYAISQGSTMDLALVRQLLEHCIQASETLQIDKIFADKLKVILTKILPFQINSKGELQEWSQDFVEHYPHHRHASHIVSVWPLSQITQQKTPELFKAAKISLENRKGGGYHPDKGAMWARLKDGDKSLASYPYYTDTKVTGQIPPKYSGIPEMLVQSHTGEIELLPALPSEWKSGKVDGLRARGNFELSLEWRESKLVKATILSVSGLNCKVHYPSISSMLVMDRKGKKVSFNKIKSDEIEFGTVKNEVYTIL